jgi:subtilisin family serine protease
MKPTFTLLLLLLLGVSAAQAGNIPFQETQPFVESGRHDWAVVTAPAEVDGTVFDITPQLAATNYKLDSGIAGLVIAPDRPIAAGAPGLRFDGDRLQLQIIARTGEEAEARRAVIAQGGQVTGAFQDTLQVWLPVDRIGDLAEQRSVRYIRLPDQAVLADEDSVSTVSEGLALSNAPTWQMTGYNGQDVRIAIIDAGFQNYTAKLGSELPVAVTVKNFVDGQSDGEVDGTTRHGTACAEIIHDMAPQAQLFLLKIATDIDLSEAVNYAIDQGVDVISTSLTFVNATPGDGTGKFANMAQVARNAGILWVTAAGNYRETHWGGYFSDPDFDAFHNFASNQEVNFFGPGNGQAYLIPAGYAIQASIRWDDWVMVNQDFTLYILRYNGSTYDIIGSSNNPQSGQGGQRPTERVSIVTSGNAAVYGVAIKRNSGERAVFFNLLTPNRELDKRVEVLSLGNLADVPAVLTVSAVGSSAPFSQEIYSSEGPTNGPGGVPEGGQRKPDIAAFANVTTTSYGVRGFNGTSAATPHVAGAAALALSAYPNNNPAQIQALLQARAIDQGVAGPDVEYGYGRLHLGQPPQPIVFTNFAFTPFVTAGIQP